MGVLDEKRENVLYSLISKDPVLWERVVQSDCRRLFPIRNIIFIENVSTYNYFSTLIIPVDSWLFL